jgi:hypothetical protein
MFEVVEAGKEAGHWMSDAGLIFAHESQVFSFRISAFANLDLRISNPDPRIPEH